MANAPKVVSFGETRTSFENGNGSASVQKFEASLNAFEGQQQKRVTIKSGDTLAKIARRNNIDLATLLAANTQFDGTSADGVHNWNRKGKGNRDADDLRVGETIVVPVLAPSVSAYAKTVSAPGTGQLVKTRINEKPDRASNVGMSGDGVSAGEGGNIPLMTGKGVTLNTGVQQTLVLTPPPSPPPPDLPEIKSKDYAHQVIVTAGGSGSKDPRSADNKVGLLIESLDSKVNPNNGTYQFNATLTMPGRVQSPEALLDATGRMTLFSLGRKPVKYTDADGNEKSVEALGVKLGGMSADNRFLSISAYGNVSGLPIGAIQQENGAAVSRESAGSPLHLGIAGSLGKLNGYVARGIGNGQVRNTADNTINTTRSMIYGADFAIPFNFKSKFALDRVHFGVTGKQTVTTPANAALPKTSNRDHTAFIESFWKVDAGSIMSLLPGQPSSTKADATGVFRMKLETPTTKKFDPKLTLRYDLPLWEIRNTVPDGKGALTVKSQMRVEAISSMQFGIGTDKSPAVQNFQFGVRARF